MPPSVTIAGVGIAACCCARLLQKRNFDVAFTRGEPSSSPTLLVNTSTQRLLADVFEGGTDLFSDMPEVRKRIVLWGNEEPIILPHSGVVVDESLLLERLWNKIEPGGACSGQPDWTIHSTSKVPTGMQQHFGLRIARTVAVRLKAAAAQDTCWIESVDAGWLFLLPAGRRRGSLIVVGEMSGDCLEGSRLIARQIDSTDGPEGRFAAHPRILEPLCGSHWLACGSGAMGFDPICGEGAGNAVREAILASAVIGKAVTQSSATEVLAHYSSRLLAGFLRHLNACLGFYVSAKQTEWWSSQATALKKGIDWTESKLSSLSEPQYRLRDFDLECLM